MPNKKILSLFSIAFFFFAVLSVFSTCEAASVYGCPWNSDGLANLEIGKSSGRAISYRFRAEHTGTADRVLIYLVFGSGGYYAGNGGQILMQVQTDDGSSSHNPSGTVLGESLVTNPMAQWNRTFVFNKPVAFEQGKLYHLVFTNPHSDPISNYVSIDDLHNSRNQANMQPGVSDTDLAVIWKPSGGSWAVNYKHTPIYCLQFTDGFKQGQGYMDAKISSGSISFSGNSKVRMSFTVSGGSRTVTEVSVRLRKNGTPGNLGVRLETGSGTVVEEGSIPSSAVSTSMNWVTYKFTTPRVLESGKGYNVVFSAPAGDSYTTYPIQKGRSYGWTAGTFTDGRYEYTTGSSWQKFQGSDDYDLQCYFTVSSSDNPDTSRPAAPTGLRIVTAD
ncbi:MAG: hypothetical protein A4E57_01074 [Syntrophorhabdaceae bacterium PtaU1.Bin034]|jgi:hypothetical protein|nr:MAG: hypothetical protein A4E57_01074 [Syntrophorhabdaceae bacterium PtaU1.Bin034]